MCGCVLKEARLIIVGPDFLVARGPVESTAAFTRVGRNDSTVKTP